MRILLWAVVIALTFYSNNTVAQTCSAIPDCSSLGYTQTASDCIKNNYTACPFDTTKVKCHQTKSCADLGYTQATSSCYGGYTVCPYDKTKVKCTSTLHCNTLGYNSYNASSTPSCKKYIRCPHDTRYFRCLVNVGDIKYTAAKSSDHDGWWRVNGRSFNPNVYADLYKALGSSTTTIPATPTGAAGNAFIYVGQDDISDKLECITSGTCKYLTDNGSIAATYQNCAYSGTGDGRPCNPMYREDFDGDGITEDFLGGVIGYIISADSSYVDILVGGQDVINFGGNTPLMDNPLYPGHTISQYPYQASKEDVDIGDYYMEMCEYYRDEVSILDSAELLPFEPKDIANFMADQTSFNHNKPMAGISIAATDFAPITSYTYMSPQLGETYLFPLDIGGGNASDSNVTWVYYGLAKTNNYQYTPSANGYFADKATSAVQSWNDVGASMLANIHYHNYVTKDATLKAKMQTHYDNYYANAAGRGLLLWPYVNVMYETQGRVLTAEQTEILYPAKFYCKFRIPISKLLEL